MITQFIFRENHQFRDVSKVRTSEKTVTCCLRRKNSRTLREEFLEITTETNSFELPVQAARRALWENLRMISVEAISQTSFGDCGWICDVEINYLQSLFIQDKKMVWIEGGRHS